MTTLVSGSSSFSFSTTSRVGKLTAVKHTSRSLDSSSGSTLSARTITPGL